MKAAIFGLVMMVLGLTKGSAGGELMIYGGEHLHDFLGCMDCSDKDEESIWNKSGPYGYATFNDSSIWSGIGCRYGGSMGEFSPFNRWAKFPPALFDSKGNFLGYLTVNQKYPKRTKVKLARLVLAYWETIKNDVPGFYDIYFESDEDPYPDGPHRKRRNSSWR
jgi:hypothetical protein